MLLCEPCVSYAVYGISYCFTVLLYINLYHWFLLGPLKGGWKLPLRSTGLWFCLLDVAKSHKPNRYQTKWVGKEKEIRFGQWDGNRRNYKRAGRLRTENKSKIGKILYLEQFSHNVSVCNVFVLTCREGQDRMRTELLKRFRYYTLLRSAILRHLYS